MAYYTKTLPSYTQLKAAQVPALSGPGGMLNSDPSHSIDMEKIPERFQFEGIISQRSEKFIFGYPRKWALIAAGILAVSIIVIGATVGGVLGTKRPEDAKDHDPSEAWFGNLAAAECDGGTFVTYQDNNTDVWLQGVLRDDSYDVVGDYYTRTLPKFKLPATGRPEIPQINNLTAVCWRDELDNVELRIFYHLYTSSRKGSGKTRRYNVVQTALTLPIYQPANISSVSDTKISFNITQSIVWSGTFRGPMAATYLKSSGIHLFVIDKVYGEMDYSIEETIWNTTSQIWATAASSLSSIRTPAFPALAVSSLDDAETGGEIYLTYSNSDRQMETTMWSEQNNTWATSTIIQPASKLRNLQRITSDLQISPGAPAMPRIHFVYKRRPYSSVLSGNFLTQKVTTSNPSAPKDRKDATSYPGLIAATTRNNKRAAVSQLFYVLKEGGGVTIWNATTSGGVSTGEVLTTF